MARKSGSKNTPAHLGAAGRAFWATVMEAFDLEPWQVRLLISTCEAADRAERARKIVDAKSEVVSDRWGQLKVNPAASIERDARATFVAGYKALGLDLGPAAGANNKGRP